ncbi:MAG: hypothetical protein JW982_14030 [Spirochaetes bacterium]|nr:hypothetical protein [Spirochaetota bacterium]
MKKIITAAAVLTVFLMFSCTPNYNKQMQESEKLFYSGKYLQAAKLLLKKVNTKNKDQLLFMMECGAMFNAGNDYKRSNVALLAAEKLYPTLAASVSKQAASIILNETTTNYRGENFELVLIHMYAGINFYRLGEIDDARVEFMKVSNLLASFKLDKNRKYDENLLAKYLTAVCYEMLGDINNDLNDIEYAYVELKQIYAINPNLPYLGQDLMRLASKLRDNEDLSMWQKKFGRYRKENPDSADFVLVFQAGRSAIKKSRGKLLQDVAMRAAIDVSIRGISLQQGVTAAGIIVALGVAEHPIPKFEKRSNKIDHIDIIIDGKKAGSTFNMVDVDKAAFLTMDDKYDKLMAKAAAGVVTKAVISIVSGYSAKKIAEATDIPFAGLIGAATGAGVGAGLASQIKPDLRCWHSLPSNFQFFKISMPVGEYNIDLNYIDAAGNIVSKKSDKVKIEKDKDILVNLRTTY